METGETLQPSADFVYCLDDGFQPSSGNRIQYDDSFAADMGERAYFEAQCPKCGNNRQEFVEIQLPQNNSSLKIPKGWKHQFVVSEGQMTTMFASSFGEPENFFSDENGAFLELRVVHGERKELKLPRPEMDEKIRIGSQDVTSFAQEDPETKVTEFITQFNQEGQTYRVKMTYNPDVYLSGKANYLIILRSFKFTT